jgi:hypothetical protein
MKTCGTVLPPSAGSSSRDVWLCVDIHFGKAHAFEFSTSV